MMMCYIIDDLPGLQYGVGHGHGKPCPSEERDIHHIIPDTGRLLRGNFPPVENLFKGFGFVPDPLMNLGDPQIGGSVFDHARSPSRSAAPRRFRIS